MINEENAAALSVPATHVNRIHAALDGDMVRLAFAEGLGGAEMPQFRLAVAMSSVNAEALLGLLADVLRVRRGVLAPLVEGAKCH